jgi:hypothetical protein
VPFKTLVKSEADKTRGMVLLLPLHARNSSDVRKIFSDRQTAVFEHFEKLAGTNGAYGGRRLTTRNAGEGNPKRENSPV